MEQCYVFARDFRDVLPDNVETHLRAQGVERYSQDVVDSLADEMFRVVEDDMRQMKEAQ
jgi:hypothetical protein